MVSSSTLRIGVLVTLLVLARAQPVLVDGDLGDKCGLKHGVVCGGECNEDDLVCEEVDGYPGKDDHCVSKEIGIGQYCSTGLGTVTSKVFKLCVIGAKCIPDPNDPSATRTGAGLCVSDKVGELGDGCSTTQTCGDDLTCEEVDGFPGKGDHCVSKKIPVGQYCSTGLGTVRSKVYEWCVIGAQCIPDPNDPSATRTGAGICASP